MMAVDGVNGDWNLEERQTNYLCGWVPLPVKDQPTGTTELRLN